DQLPHGDRGRRRRVLRRDDLSVTAGRAPRSGASLTIRMKSLMSFIEAHGIVKTYPVGGAPLTVLRDLDLRVEAGEMLAIVGASGVGKSTLLHLLGGLDRVDSGSVAVAGVELAGLSDGRLVAFRTRHVGFVFQFHHLLPH